MSAKPTPQANAERALAVFGAEILDTFTEYWGDLDGGDVQGWAEDAGVFDVHVKDPLPANPPADWSESATGLCGGLPCAGETEPGDTCYHIKPAVREAMRTLAGLCPRCGSIVPRDQRASHRAGTPSECDRWVIEVAS